VMRVVGAGRVSSAVGHPFARGVRAWGGALAIRGVIQIRDHAVDTGVSR